MVSEIKIIEFTTDFEMIALTQHLFPLSSKGL